MKYCTLVTGATGAIGGEVVKLLKAAGREVLAIGGELDLTLPDALSGVESFIRSQYDGVDGFVHCAGFDRPAPLGMVEPLVATDLFRVHALFPMLFLGWMGKRRNHAPGSAAVLVSSEVLAGDSRGHVAYAAAKGALEAMAQGAAAELADAGVRVAILRLPPVDTPMTRTWLDKLPVDKRPPLISASEAAGRIVDEFQKGAIVWKVGT